MNDGDIGRETEDFRSKYLYALAELENLRKRCERRADDMVFSARQRLLEKFLTVVDNLERAVKHPDPSQLRAGLEATLRVCETLLASEGVTPIRTAGQPFDPTVAEAVEIRAADDVPDETVVAEERRGYRSEGRVLRPAQVVVAKNG